jgi:hypothetical protein
LRRIFALLGATFGHNNLRPPESSGWTERRPRTDPEK